MSEFIDKVRDLNIHVVGLCGAETSAIARYLHKSGCKKLTFHDFNRPSEFKNIFDVSHVSYNKDDRERILNETLDIPAVKHFRDEYLVDILDADIIFVGQNWFNYDFNAPALYTAREMGIPLWTITELYFSLIPARIIGVTGTNGKTTTANLIRFILEKSGRKTYFSGNDRYSKQIIEQVDEISASDSVVLEISNRQLISLKVSPHIAVITNIAHDHIAEHGSYGNYIAVKKKLFLFQDEKDFAVLNCDDATTKGFAGDIKSRPFFYSLIDEFSDDGAYVKDDLLYAAYNGVTSELIHVDDLQIKGWHNVSNTLAASMAALIYGVSPDDISAALKEFSGIKNRLEHVRELSGINFYNDISSTSPHATIAAINSFESSVILIAGGEDKFSEYDELCGLINDKVKSAIFLPGTATDKMLPMLKSYEERDSLFKAVNVAYDNADEGDTVILSPAAAGFFTKYVAGKQTFNKIVKRLKRK